MIKENWSYSRNREEVYCKHGVGHPAPWSNKSLHGCCGCCSKDEFEVAAEELKPEEINYEFD